MDSCRDKAWRDVGGLCADRADPLLHRFGDELWAVIGTEAEYIVLAI
jgi:hypothetical protein